MNNGEYSCPFCTEINRDHIISESNHSLAILDRYPVSYGHTLIILKRHCPDYFNLSKSEQRDLWNMVSEVQERMTITFKPDGFNVGINISEAAGQTVPHVHIHLIPRYHGDTEDPRGGIRHCIRGKGYYNANLTRNDQ
jgi:diadenosine tetraphosphate (Ap4A) HIT family hydrolase